MSTASSGSPSVPSAIAISAANWIASDARGVGLEVRGRAREPLATAERRDGVVEIGEVRRERGLVDRRLGRLLEDAGEQRALGGVEPIGGRRQVAELERGDEGPRVDGHESRDR